MNRDRPKSVNLTSGVGIGGREDGAGAGTRGEMRLEVDANGRAVSRMSMHPQSWSIQ